MLSAVHGWGRWAPEILKLHEAGDGSQMRNQVRGGVARVITGLETARAEAEGPAHHRVHEW